MNEARVIAAFEEQAMFCGKMGSGLVERLMRVAPRVLDGSTETGRRILGWQGPPEAKADNVPLRLAGALHALVRAEALPDLATHYPPNPLPSEDVMADAVRKAIAKADARISQWLDFAPQTNEVGRSAVIYPGLMRIAAETGLPMVLWELGASGGLNLAVDRYAYDLGGVQTGLDGSALTLVPEWRGARPEGVVPEVVGRRGCDLNPLDIRDPEMQARLAAYVWPDQPERLARLEAATRIAAAMDLRIDRAGAGDWVAARLAEPAQAGVARVIFHTIAFQYFPAREQARITEMIEAAGARATAETPLAWLSFESRPDLTPEISLRVWPGGERATLGTAHAHGTWIDWAGGSP